MKKSSICNLFVALFCLFLAGFAGAQDKKMYSWTDESGTVHFTDTLPEGQAVRELDIPQDPTPATSNPYQESNTGPSAADQKRAEIGRKNEENQANKALNSVQCSSWQQELARLEPNRRVFYTNDQGETERMDDVKRSDRVAELKSQIARNCK